MQFATINGVSLHYQVIGAPEDKPTMVFVNSLGSDFRIWRDVIVRLVGEVAIITYDKRGHGLSDLGESQTMDDHVADLEGLLDHLGVQHPIICGLSVGGLIAQSLYHKRKDLAGALILCNTGTHIGSDEIWNMRIETVQTKGLSHIANEVMSKWFTREFREENPAETNGYINMLTRTPVQGYIGTCAAIRDSDLSTLAEDISIPTICIAGDQDESTPPELMKQMAKTIPDAFYEEIKDCGHIPTVQQPEYLTEVIKSFMGKLSRTED
ncbi:3-oxoadipate enol-lactonase [Lentilitoribacter sp. EG35]|uniref:3-oxoadipate enol-lactonase n=1 Tax=Lentilitoribacter sp. EG35 TaxID=3234192 RepID=UPI00346076B2